MRAVLSTEIRVERVAVFAEMAFIERRPELGLVARAAQASGHLTPVAVQSALPGLTDRARATWSSGVERWASAIARAA